MCECRLCGESNPENFYKNSKSKCKKCYTARVLEYYRENREAKIEYQREWVTKNRPKVRALKGAKEGRRKLRKVSWLSKDDKRWMQDIYATAIEVSGATGQTHHVDHIVPLLGKTVSGLHVPWNLQIIPADENMMKRNSFSE